MDIEEEIISYLHEYGNTKESDILRYIKSEFRYSDRGGKKLIERLQRQGKVFRIVHAKLRPPAVYLALKEFIPLEIQKELIRAESEFRKAEFDYYARVESSRNR